MVEHHNLSNFLLDMQQRTGITASDKLLAVTTLSFDIAALELYLPLISGSFLYLAARETASDGFALQQLMRHDISFMQATPATWQLLKQSDWIAPAPLNILCGGEALSPELANYLLENGKSLWNVYGPTETTVWSSAYSIQTLLNTYPLIGQPIANTRIYILSAQHQPLPPGIPGELCIAGAGLARGYLNRSELTAEKFIQIELFGKTERLYKTGDLARWLPDGNLEYLGRLDHQIKLRGFRIELGEIETLINQHQAVKEAVVTLYQADDNKRLVAYLTTHSSSESNELVASLKDTLKASLPDYMVPSHFTVLDKLPLTPNGKIDRKALPAPEIQLKTGTQPKTPTEDLLAGLMAFVLKRSVINRDDNFFELGGHSLLATQLIARIRDSFKIELPVRAIFEHPSVTTLAAAISAATGTVRLPAIQVQSTDSPKILSFAQQRLWFLNQFEGNNAAYNMPAALQLSGHLDVEALQQSLHWLLARHTNLRTYFPTYAGQAQVHIQAIDKIEVLQIHDLSLLPVEAQSHEVQSRANRHAIAPFDLAQGPLFCASLLQLNEHQSVLLLNMHHIISDGWSMGIFFRDLQHAYTAFVQGEQPNLAPLAIQYSDYAAWQRDWLQGEVLQQQVDYWYQQLAGCPELLELPTDKPRPPEQSYQGAYYFHRLSPALSQAVTTLSRQHSVSVFMTLLTTFFILLSRYSRQEDLCVGSSIANRTHSHTEDLMGFFVNTLVLRSQLKPQQSFTDLLLETRQTCLEAYAHQNIPFEILLDQLQLTRSLSHSPLFQVMFILQNQAPAELVLPNLDITALRLDYPIAKFDLTLSIEEQNGQFHCIWEYTTDLFYAETIERMARHFEVLLTKIVENPAQSISHLPMLTKKEIQQLQGWNETATDYPFEQTIVDLFEQQVEKTPNNIAVVFEEQQLSYQQLNDKANQLAYYLLSLKTQAGTVLLPNNPLIAIAVERSFYMVIGLLGILKAGGAYVPIDPGYPQARIRYMLDDSAAPLLLTQSHSSAHWSLDALEHDCVVVCLDDADFADQPTENPAVSRTTADLAYVIYTSGSTGKPKGVMIEHSALSNFIHSSINAYSFASQDKVLQFASVSFDTAAEEIYPTLLQGATLILRTAEMFSTTETFLTICDEKKLTVLDLPTAYWHNLLTDMQIIKKHWPKSIRLVLIGGEAVSGESIRQWLENFGHFPILLNTYGPTETTVVATRFQFETDLITVSIGQPIANTRIYILDAQYQPQPPGIPGELCIAGACLARGYLKRPELTKEKFIEVELFGKTERIYKTGDLARWQPDGNLEYLGRLDHQVKLRGFRIELGEIEACLRQHQAVKETVVILYEADDNKRLVAYITTDSEQNELVAELKETLTASLPDYMIPSYFSVLDGLPLTPNGKIDRQALPAPDSNTPTENTLPRDSVELQLLSVWETVLNVHPLGIHDNFFELGGHSLLAVKLMSHIQQQCGVRLPVSALFQSPTIASLAQQLHQDTTPLLTNLVPIQTAGEANPVYALPGAVGSVMYLYPLSSYLGQQQPFYALQTPGLDGSTTPETVSALARFHLQALRKQQPEGPYQLIGHSSGGRVAFEMAWQLEQQGETVAFLGILDTSAPDTNQPNPMADYTELNWLSDIVQEFEKMLGIDLNLSLEQLRAMPEIEIAYAKVMQAFVEREIFFAPNAPVTELKALVNTYRITVQGHADYQIHGKVHCPIHLFRASEQMAETEFEDKREAWGWASGTHAKVEEHWVPGTHLTMMALPHVEILADKLAQCLSHH
jgi:amino acid adenylation domain-containing protein